MQNTITLSIKGMVCERCINVIKSELKKAGVATVKVELGEVTVISSNHSETTRIVQESLGPLGFQLLEDKKAKTLNELKNLVAEVYSGSYDFPNQMRFSDVVASRLHKDYDTLSALFSLHEQKTLERYIMDYRIEKIKEYLVYSSLTLSDIAFRLNFSSVPHLSRQFKQYTGLTPSHFKQIKTAKEEQKKANT